jgi:hypothetical protein
VEERFAPGVFALQSLLMFAASRRSVGEKRPLAEPPK